MTISEPQTPSVNVPMTFLQLNMLEILQQLCMERVEQAQWLNDGCGKRKSGNQVGPDRRQAFEKTVI
jgi:hypothetical protein